MMKRQMSFAGAESAGKKRATKRQRFLDEMEKAVRHGAVFADGDQSPVLPRKRGAWADIGLERMLRTYFLQRWYELSDERLEDALYDSVAMLAFAGIDLAVENVPDATTLLNFRHLFVEHDMTRKLFGEIGISLCEQDPMRKEGTLVDAARSSKRHRRPRTPRRAETRSPRCIGRRKATSGISV